MFQSTMAAVTSVSPLARQRCCSKLRSRISPSRPKEMLSLLEKVQLAGAGFLSLTEVVDTTTAAGRMMMQMVGAFAEFERAMLRERTRSGLMAARQEGRIGGRRPKLTPRQQQEIIHLVDTGQKTAADAARLFNVHPSTVARLMARSHSAEATSA